MKDSNNAIMDQALKRQLAQQNFYCVVYAVTLLCLLMFTALAEFQQSLKDPTCLTFEEIRRMGVVVDISSETIHICK